MALSATAAAADLKSTLSATVSDTSVTYAAQICNLTTTAVTGAKLRVFYNLASAPTCAAACPSTNCVEWASLAVPASQCVTRTQARTAVPLGSYTAWARSCDGGDTVPANDVSSADYVIRPDLIVESFTAGAVGSTHDIAYSLTVKNVGASFAGSQQIALGLYYDRAAAPTSEAPDQTFTFGPLAANATFTKTFTRYGAPTKKYSSWALVDRGNLITEKNEGNNVRQAVVSVGPNIFVYAPTTTVSGTAVSHGVKLCNTGNIATGQFKASLWYNRSAAPACPATGESHSWMVSTLTAAGTATACTTLSHTQNNPVGGDFKAWVMADPSCSLAESDEGDNVQSKTYAVGKPDLKLDSFATSVSGSAVTFKTKLCNLGATTGVALKVGLFYKATAAPACGAAVSFTWPDIAGLATGQCTNELSHTATISGAGAFNAYAFADPGCVVAETSETNNQRAAAYALAADKPDLYISSFAVTVSGTTVDYKAQVCNGGLATTASIKVGFYYNKTPAAGAPDQTESATGGIAAGACKPITHHRTGAAPGSYTAWVKADSDGTLAEMDENNNTDSDTYKVETAQKPDLEVKELTVKVNGSTVTYTAVVKNAGAAAAGAATIGLFHDRAAAPSATCTDSADDTDTATLAAGAQKTLTWSRSAAAPGAYKAWVLADSACAVAESNEANNTKSIAYTVTGGSADLGVSPDSGSRDAGVGPDTGSPSSADGPVYRADKGKGRNDTEGGCQVGRGGSTTAPALLLLACGLLVLRLRPRRRR